MNKKFLIIAFFYSKLLLCQIISTVAGTGVQGSFGDGGLATNANLNSPTGIALDPVGNFYIASCLGHNIRKVDNANIINPVIGTGIQGNSGDGGQAINAEIACVWGLGLDTAGNIYIADVASNCIRKVNTSGVITTIAGNGTSGYSGDGGPAINAQLDSPNDVIIDPSGNIYIVEIMNNCVRKINTSGIITTVAGTGTTGYSGDGGPALMAQLYRPSGIALDVNGNLFIADNNNNCIRKVDASGIITTVAGTGVATYSGDGGPATSAGLFNPKAIAVDVAGNIYIADDGNNVIRKVNTSGVISTIAGTGSWSYGGDGGLATLAGLKGPTDLGFDQNGNLYIVDNGNMRIRMVSNVTTMIINEKRSGQPVTVYPNPASNFFDLQTSETDLQTVTVIDQRGEQILNENIRGTTKIDLSNFDSGIYTLIIKSNQSVVHNKLIIAH